MPSQTEQPDFPTTGSLRKLSTILHGTAGYIHQTSGQSSSTTGERLPVPTRANSTGTQRRGTGAVVKLGNMPTALKTFGLPETSVRLARFIERACAWRVADVFGADGQFEASHVGEVVIRKGTAEEIEAVTRAVDALLDPAPADMAATKLAELRAVTVHRARDGIDVELLATAYTQRLTRYPVDVIAAACDAWADREEFWPSWAELKAECDKRMRGRLALARALETFR